MHVFDVYVNTVRLEFRIVASKIFWLLNGEYLYVAFSGKNSSCWTFSLMVKSGYLGWIQRICPYDDAIQSLDAIKSSRSDPKQSITRLSRRILTKEITWLYCSKTAPEIAFPLRKCAFQKDDLGTTSMSAQ